jgi:hypothetical protein
MHIEYLKGSNLLEGLRTDGRIIVNRILKIYECREKLDVSWPAERRLTL